MAQRRRVWAPRTHLGRQGAGTRLGPCGAGVSGHINRLHPNERWRELEARGQFPPAPATLSGLVTGFAGAFSSNRLKSWSERQDLNLSPSPDSQGVTKADTQRDAQSLVALGHDLSRVVTAWSKLSPPLKAAILAIVNSSEGAQ